MNLTYLKLSLCILHFFVVSLLKGQGKSECDPFSVKLGVVIQAKIGDFECGFSDIFRYNIGLKADYFRPKKSSYFIGWNQSIFSGDFGSLEKKFQPDAIMKPFRMMEGGGRFYLSDKEGTANLQIYLGTKGRFSYWGKRDIDIRKIIGLRGGVYNTRTPVNSNWRVKDESNGRQGRGITTKDGNVIGVHEELYSTMYTNGVFAGLTWIQVANCIYQSYGKKMSSSFLKEVYFDLLYTPNIRFEPFMAKDQDYNSVTYNKYIPHEIEANVKGSIKTSNIGWRVGVYRLKFKKAQTVTFGLEAGARPGVFFRGGYFTSSIQVAFVQKSINKK